MSGTVAAETARSDPTAGRRRGAIPGRSATVVAVTAALGGAAIVGVALPAMWMLSPPYAGAFAVLVAADVTGVALLLARRARVGPGLLAGAGLGILLMWVAGHVLRVLPDPDPWLAMDGVLGLTDWLCAAMHGIALIALGVAQVSGRRPRPARSAPRRALAATATTALLLVVVPVSVVGTITSSDGFAGIGAEPLAVLPPRLPAGRRSTVEYCRPDGIPLAMDLYVPDDRHRRPGPAPVVLYVHGGGLVLGNRLTNGPGASLAGHREALFGPVRRRLNSHGLVVASIDYRLTPAAPWHAPLEDAKCAVRFLRANATRLGIAPDRIGAWGSSAGGQLASLLGLAHRSAGFDVGEHADLSSSVQAVVDMFGPSDVAHLQRSNAFVRTTAWLSLGGSSAVRRAMSPMTYVAAGAPPFLVLHGRQDTGIPFEQSTRFVDRLQDAGVPVTFVPVDGTGHGLASPHQRPSPTDVSDRVVDFLVRTLGRG